ncbi:MAG: hypothetical protein N2B03_03765, partial [Boseongicola sp.]
MQDIINAFLNVANLKKAGYGDIRVIDKRRESITVRNAIAEDMTQVSTLGFGVRVMVNGRWGFASSMTVSEAEVAMITEQAIRIATASSAAGGDTQLWAEAEAVQGEFVNKVEQDPFAISIEDKLARLVEADAIMAKAAPVTHRAAF